MKTRSLVTTALLAATVLLGAGPSAKAVLTINTGDLFLGFKGTGDAQDYLIDLGNVAQFSSLDGSTFTVNLGGSIGADLATAFSDWANRDDVFWGAAGTTYDGVENLTATIYLTRARSQLTPNTQSVPWTARSNSGQLSSVSLIQGLAGLYKDQGAATLNSTKATFQTASTSNTFASLTVNNSDFLVGGNIEGAFSSTSGTANSVLDLYQIDPTNSVNPGTKYLGKFTIDNAGVVQFTAVPEPSTYGLIVGAGAILLALKRRGDRRRLNHA